MFEKFAAIQMPTGRWLLFARYTQPEKGHRLLHRKRSPVGGQGAL